MNVVFIKTKYLFKLVFLRIVTFNNKKWFWSYYIMFFILNNSHKLNGYG